MDMKCVILQAFTTAQFSPGHLRLRSPSLVTFRDMMRPHIYATRQLSTPPYGRPYFPSNFPKREVYLGSRGELEITGSERPDSNTRTGIQSTPVHLTSKEGGMYRLFNRPQGASSLVSPGSLFIHGAVALVRSHRADTALLFGSTL